MNEPISGTASLIYIKLFGMKAFLGMIGTSLLYLALPPVDPSGRLNKKEFFFRLACAGTFSGVFGDAAVDFVAQHINLHAADMRAAIYLAVGAPAWFVTRALAVWLNRRKDKDLAEVVHEFRG